ncbi:MAG: hypothetical protein M1483_06325 [Actinobacteria bacterium]|jgi:hypothetical protein|nr:hypothetical protein [Actinomycetota bacterium]MCL6105221.1 hypothetical protein [Actinomycetota bacterium]
MSWLSKSRQRHLEEQSKYAEHWNGPTRPYDIVKEFTIAFIVVAVLTFVLAIVFSSPDIHAVTIQEWATATPRNFLSTALLELEKTSPTATYGPPYDPYNKNSSNVQQLGPISPQRFFGVKYPINSSVDFVLQPLESTADDPDLTQALHAYITATKSRQLSWDHAWGRELSHSTVIKGQVIVPPGNYGPVGKIMSSLFRVACSGGLDAALVAHEGFFTNNYTKPIMFIGDSAVAFPTTSYWGKIVTSQHMVSNQWGMMNETGNWPGQPWLWLYTMWYQIAPFSTSSNADIMVMAIMGLLSLVLMFLPFIPCLRRIPEYIPVHKLIWRRYYERHTKQA